jgi:CO/xanthine dehydrogenase Mo-binding subunit
MAAGRSMTMTPSPPATPTLVGTSVPRKEALPKVTGAARYVDDMSLPDMVYGATVRSPVPRGRLRGFSLIGDLPWAEFTLVTASDIPGDNVVALINDDQPALAGDLINHAEEPVVLLAHPDRALLLRARDQVQLHIDPLPPVLSIEEALAGREIIWGKDNLLRSYRIEKGDPDRVFAEADLIIEGDYTTGAQEQLYIEPNGVIASASPDGVTIWGSLQCPYYVQKALMRLFALPPDRARVIQMETGGGFGGKEEYPSMISAHAALLSRKAGRPVKMIYDRAEDMAATTKRHPSRTRHRTALDRDGRILAMDVDFVIDGGAYSTLSQVVLSRGSIHAAGPYACDHLRIRGRAVATNTPPNGAFRGFGAPQSLFALERHMDVIARTLGLPPEELRRRNFIKKGGTLATGQIVRDDIDMQALLDTALRLSGFAEKQARFQAENQKDPAVRRGMGLCCFLHGTGFTGSGEKYLRSQVTVEATAQGKVRVLSSSTEIGQGTNTVFAQLAADALGTTYERVEVARPDTADVPDSGPTVASRTCAIVGKLVQGAATSLRRALIDGGLLPDGPSTPEAFQAACLAHLRERGPLRATATYEQPPFIKWDEERFRGDAYGAYSWAVYVAQVRVDLTTYEAQVEDFWAVQEVGKVVHPLLAAGQIEGGVVQGIGYALYEKVAWRDGRMANNRMTDYIIPTSADVPPIHVRFEEAPYPYGASGAKGIGELPMDGPAPAILNAIHDALGKSITSVPATPEVILAALEGEHV